MVDKNGTPTDGDEAEVPTAEQETDLDYQKSSNGEKQPTPTTPGTGNADREHE